MCADVVVFKEAELLSLELDVSVFAGTLSTEITRAPIGNKSLANDGKARLKASTCVAACGTGVTGVCAP